MSKIMVVEDDASLREIYSIRITAEGYDVVSAGDGEEALAVAVREKPDLILSDIMMPKISGFDMLDILRSTPETASIKVVMMTALSAEDQRRRGERLGADRYLVKSQVGIEDVINVIHEVLGDREPAQAPGTTPELTQAPVVTPEPMPAPETSQPPVAPLGLSQNPMNPPVSIQTPEIANESAQSLISNPVEETPVQPPQINPAPSQAPVQPTTQSSQFLNNNPTPETDGQPTPENPAQ